MGLDWEWESLPEWMDHLDRLPKGVNVLNYVPLNPLLVYVLGLEGATHRVDEARAMHEVALQRSAAQVDEAIAQTGLDRGIQAGHRSIAFIAWA